jgi:hypothetical protein
LISCGGGRAAPLRRTTCQEWIWRFSYQKYNQGGSDLQTQGAGDEVIR